MTIQSLARSVTGIVFGLAVVACVAPSPVLAIIAICTSMEATMQLIGVCKFVAWRALVLGE